MILGNVQITCHIYILLFKNLQEIVLFVTCFVTFKFNSSEGFVVFEIIVSYLSN